MTLLNFLLTLFHGRQTRSGIPVYELIKARIQQGRYRALAPLLFDELRNSGVHSPPDFLKQAYFAQLTHFAMLERENASLLELLRKNGVDCLPYKGMDLGCRFYRTPHLRPQGDIDILIKPADRDRLGILLASQEYQFTWGGHYHAQYLKNGLYFEFHTRVVSYKYEVYFELQKLTTSALIEMGAISPEQYLLISALQHYDEMGARLTPLVDIFQIISHGINPDAWNGLLTGCDAAFPVLFCHFTMAGRFGYSPLPEFLLPRTKPSRLEDIRRLAINAVKRNQTYPLLFRMSRNKTRKILKSMFPPPEVYASYTQGCKMPRLLHLKKVWDQIRGHSPSEASKRPEAGKNRLKKVCKTNETPT